MPQRIRNVLAASAAMLALVAVPPAFAQGQGNGNGNGRSGGGGQPESAARGNPGNGNAGERGNGNGNADRGNRGGPETNVRGNGNGNGANDRGGPPTWVERGNGSANAGRSNGNGNSGVGNGNARNAGNAANGNFSNGNSGNRNAGLSGNGSRNGSGNYSSGGTYFGLSELYDTGPRLIDGCPPGLAQKRNGCLPPGQAKQRYRSYEPDFFGLWGADRGDYYYNDGYLLRYRGDSLLGYLPLLGGALGIGNIWPSYYEPRPVPDYYSSYYGLGDPGGYRYADNVLYRVDPQTSAIGGIAALLTGDQFEVGRPMPAGYDVYNVPYGYRDRYYDTPDARYRYADGRIYQVDPTTSLIAAVIDLVL